VKTVLPDLTFDSRLTLDLGGRKVEIMYLGAGQNPGDTLIHFPHARAIYVGGPFARKNWSNMSFTPSLDGWIALLKKIAAYGCRSVPAGARRRRHAAGCARRGEAAG
jgi:hypothetical protein